MPGPGFLMSGRERTRAELEILIETVRDVEDDLSQGATRIERWGFPEIAAIVRDASFRTATVRVKVREAVEKHNAGG